MKKRIVSLLLTLTMTLGLASGLATPASAAESDFVIENGVLMKYLGTSVDVVIPDGVTAIDRYAFFGRDVKVSNPDIRSLVIPEGVTEIPYMCFAICRSLERVTLPQSLTTIGGFAFSEAESLTSIELPNGLKTIGSNAFNKCTSLKSIVIPDNVTEIGYGAFWNCTSLTDITLPATASIGGYAFEGTPWLENGGSSQGGSQRGLIVVGDTVVGNNYKFGDKVGHLEIPKGIRVIAGDALQSLSSMTSVTIPEGVEEINDWAFSSCRQLTELNLPSTIKLVAYNAFTGCSGLTEVTFPAGLEEVGDVAFSNCTNLKTVTFLGKDTKISNSAFPTGITIRGYWGSTAEKYANYTFSTFEPIDGSAQQQVVAPKESPVVADPNARAAETTNAGKQRYDGAHADTIKSYLYQRDDGNFTRVEYTKGYSYVVVEVYDRNFSLLTHKEIPTELSIWGGFFAGEDYNFLIFGAGNSKDRNETTLNKEVVRVVKYSKDWERLGCWSGYGMNTNQPFDFATVRCDEKDGILTVRTAHTMFAQGDGVSHQANWAFSVRQSDMTQTACAGSSNFSFVSHSMNQFVLIDDDGVMVTLDQGDANPRALVMNIHPDYRRGVDSADFTFGHTTAASINLVHFPMIGNLHYNYTGAYVGGLELSGTHYVAAANLYASEFDDEQGMMIYAVDKRTRAVTQYQLASGGNFSCPQMMKFSNDKLLVLWEEKNDNTNTLYYSFLDSTGKPVGGVKTTQGRLSDCKPILANGKAVWYVTGDYMDNAPTFYVMDGSGNLSSTAIASAESGRQPSAWAREQVNEAISLGLVTDYLQDYYTIPAYRSAFCDLADALYSKVVPTPIVPTGQFAEINSPTVARMATIGVFQGVGNNLYDLFSDVTREQAATMLYRLAAAAGKPLPEASASFTDMGEVSSWASQAVGAVQAAGIMGGVGNNRFDPKGDYTLEQSIVTMLRMYHFLKG